MDTLPPELFIQILEYLPKSSSSSARLTSRRFNDILLQRTFDTLRTFVEPEVAKSTLLETLDAMPFRRSAIWSPRCLVPDDIPLPRSFLLAMYAALEGRPWSLGKHTARRKLMLGDSSSDESSGDESDAMSVDGYVASSSSVGGFEEAEATDDEEYISVETMLGRVSRRDVTESMLRQAMFRYALYQSYLYTGEGESPQLWIMHPKVWDSKVTD